MFWESKKRVIILCAYLMLYAFSAYAVKVVFRLDDVTVQYDSVHCRAMQLFADKNVPLSITVIPCDVNENPYCPNDSFYLSLLNSPIIEVCLHGLTHVNCDHHGEFGGMSIDEAERRIQKGKNILSDYIKRDIVTFVPPFNILDQSCLPILYSNCFRIVSSELFEPIPCDDRLCYVPETLGAFMGEKCIWEIARECIFGCDEEHAVCVVMFHANDLLDEEAWSKLRLLLDDCTASPDVELYTFASLLESGEVCDKARFQANIRAHSSKRISLSKGVLHPTYLCNIVLIVNTLLHWSKTIVVCLLVLLLIGFGLKRYVTNLIK